MGKIDSFYLESKIEVNKLFNDPYSILKCDECCTHLGFWRTLRCAIGKAKGTAYFVKCKRCGFQNKRFKGAYKNEVSKL